MCTLSWKWSNEAFHLFFNRDESKDRPEAIEPTIFTLDENLKCLAAKDPQGGGTWLGVNSKGLIVAIVNDYQSSYLPGEEKLRSRGLLVLDTLKNKDLQYCEDFLRKTDFSCYPGFLLHIFNLDEGGIQVAWNGEKLVRSNLKDVTQPISSSSMFPKEARAYRENLFSDSFSKLEQQKFHRYHDEQNPALSPWMKREDAHSHSYTEIELSKTQVSLQYGKTVSEALLSQKMEMFFD